MMMLLARLTAPRGLASQRSLSCLRIGSFRYASQIVKNKTPRTATPRPVPTPQYASKRPAYPERLLIYHSGTGRTVFLGCLKVTTIFIFVFFTLVVAPAHYYAEDEPEWVAPAVLLSGAVPVVFVAYITSPFVNYIHLKLPNFARNSRDLLMRYSKNPPKDAQIDITTMNFVGKPRVTRLDISELQAVKQRFGVVNFSRDTKKINATRKWWMPKAVRVFGVHGGAGRVREGEAWENIAKKIRKVS
ncbi:hypothetical protein BCIN_01g11180 [Botrytis cinerea B05.10]|uniref:Uncharacterized protein n=1 Tax=Botryotinia fuckeliana (strain B05.10) TaxID=332648 RepID=A0A384J7S9_BOTFB|nr:hypothetical protein BCIN_01g11180 [Botrytis cinerea B05.10]ATZ46540.1 hypothetical protein BCIN_01g11180 [Botrytis cinerea B05.10]